MKYDVCKSQYMYPAKTLYVYTNSIYKLLQ